LATLAGLPNKRLLDLVGWTMLEMVMVFVKKERSNLISYTVQTGII
jgi:hypothetical protein